MNKDWIVLDNKLSMLKTSWYLLVVNESQSLYSPSLPTVSSPSVIWIASSRTSPAPPTENTLSKNPVVTEKFR